MTTKTTKSANTMGYVWKRINELVDFRAGEASRAEKSFLTTDGHGSISTSVD